MENIKTCHGTLSGATVLDRHANGVPSLITLNRPSMLSTPYGALVPQHCAWADGRRHDSVISLYANGNIKFMTMQHPTPVLTPAGEITAEGLFFYEDGTLKRVFPLYGKLSGYWSENNEYKLATPIKMVLRGGVINAKMLGLAFYPSGALKSLTLWPQERIVLHTPVGNVTIRIGVSFYENGEIRSIEPARPLEVDTAIGRIYAYDPLPTGINGDVNSLLFSENGEVTSLATVNNQVEVSFAWGNSRIFAPDSGPSLCSDLVRELLPLRLCFTRNYIMICNKETFTFSMLNHRFRVLEYGSDAEVERKWEALAECCS